MLRSSFSFTLLTCMGCFGIEAAPTSSSTISNRADEVEVVDESSTLGIREVRRVTSLQNCMDHCRQCAGLVHYPDNVCIIFNKLTRVVLVSFGATCCFTVDGQSELQCARCDQDEQDDGLGIRSCHCKHIGLYSEATDNGTFRWRDGSPVDYLNWKPGEPYGNGPHCAYIWQTNGWVSGKCTDAYGGCCAVCQKSR